jgi:hypothetical protein
MDNPTYTQAAAEAISRASSTSTFVETMQMVNAAAGTLSYVNAPQPLTAKLESGETVTFYPLNFKVSEPELSTEDIPELTILCDGIDGDFLDFWNAAASSKLVSEVRLRMYDADNLEAPMQRQALSVSIRAPLIKQLQAQLKGVFADLNNAPFLHIRYGRDQFPSLSE